ncbi:MAG TPA: NfeD family protein [Longimicrobiaceae bacterium]|nr:NfeD family protein [Longimicrobiaceae bacterium]
MRTFRTLAAAALATGALSAALAPAQQAGRVVYRIPITGAIVGGLVPFVERSLREAEEAGAAAVILEMDTPGGGVDAAEQIADALHDSRVPTFAFVNPRALSAGALIALATDGIYMRPGASLGAATPVFGDGSKAPEKYVSAMRSEFRALAEARGLDPAIAEAMVDEDVEVPGVDARGKLLTLSTAGAVRVGYAREAADLEAVKAAAGAPGATVVTPRKNWAEKLVGLLTNPLVAPFLLSFGFLGLIVELKTPTFGLAGVTGLASLAAFFGSHLLVGLAGWESLILVALGIVLLLVEVLVLPGFGIAGVMGVCAILASILLAMLGSFPTTGDLAVALGVIVSALVMIGLAVWGIVTHLPKGRRTSQLFLQTSLGRSEGYLSHPVRADLEGAQGVALTDLRPSGTAAFGDEKMDVVTEGDYVRAGTPVRVVRSEGYRHIVRPVTPAAG